MYPHENVLFEAAKVRFKAVPVFYENRYLSVAIVGMLFSRAIIPK
jgi:hypothetical protein